MQYCEKELVYAGKAKRTADAHYAARMRKNNERLPIGASDIDEVDLEWRTRISGSQKKPAMQAFFCELEIRLELTTC